MGCGPHRAGGDHGQEGTALGRMLAQAQPQHQGGHHEGAAAHAHHAGKKTRQRPAGQQDDHLGPAGEGMGKLGKVGFGEQNQGNKDEKDAEGPLQLPFGQDIGKRRAEPGGEDGGRGQEHRSHNIHRALQVVRHRPGQAGEDQGHQTGAVRLVLSQSKKVNHQGDHDDTPAQTHQTAEKARGQADEKTHSALLFFDLAGASFLAR